MNDKTITILGGVLAAQLALAGLFGLGGSDVGATAQGEPLLALEQGRVDRLVIEQGEQKTVLVKEAGGWRLPDLAGFPADGERVDALVAKLAGLKTRLAVATSADAAARFKVAEGAFERRITLEGGGSTLATLYLGNAAGPRRSYARADGAGAVHEVELGTWEANARPNDWADRDHLHLDEARIARVELPGVVLERKDDAWQVAGLAEGEETVADQAEAAVRKLANLSFLEVLTDAPEAEPALTATLALKSGETRTLSFAKLKEGGDYLLKSSVGEHHYKVAAYVVDGLKESGRQQLVRAAPPPAGEGSAAVTVAEDGP